MQKRIDGDFDSASGSRVGDYCMDSVHILDMIAIGSADKFCVRCKGVG